MRRRVPRTARVFFRSEESLRDFRSFPGVQQVAHCVKGLGDGFSVIFVAVVTERNRGFDDSRADVRPGCIETPVEKLLGKLVVPGPLPLSTPCASERRVTAFLKEISVVKERH